MAFEMYNRAIYRSSISHYFFSRYIIRLIFLTPFAFTPNSLLFLQWLQHNVFPYQRIDWLGSLYYQLLHAFLYWWGQTKSKDPSLQTRDEQIMALLDDLSHYQNEKFCIYWTRLLEQRSFPVVFLKSVAECGLLYAPKHSYMDYAWWLYPFWMRWVQRR